MDPFTRPLKKRDEGIETTLPTSRVTIHGLRSERGAEVFAVPLESL